MLNKITVARPYARAAFELAFEKQALTVWSDMLYLASLLVRDPDFSALIKNPKFTEAMAVEWIVEIGSEDIQPLFKRFLQLLAEQKRLACLPEILEQFEMYRKESEKTADAWVTSARPLSEKDKGRIQEMLKSRLKVLGINMTCEIDETLLAGAVVKAKDIVIDSSIKGRLHRLGEALGL